MNRLLLIGVLMIGLPGTAFAQSRPSANAAKPSIRLFALADYTTVAAQKSFDAVFGKHTTIGPGVGLDVVNLWQGAFVRVAGSQSTLNGERVIVVDGEVFKLGIPLEAKMTPLEFGAGWRFASRSSAARVAPYLGASAISMKYTETSQFADSADNVDQTFNGFAVFGGADFRVTKQIFAGIEAQYRSIKISPSDTSAAGSFNEKDLGGIVLRVRAGIRF